MTPATMPVRRARVLDRGKFGIFEILNFIKNCLLISNSFAGLQTPTQRNTMYNTQRFSEIYKHNFVSHFCVT